MSPNNLFLFFSMQEEKRGCRWLEAPSSWGMGAWGDTGRGRRPPSNGGINTTRAWERGWGRPLTRDPNAEPSTDAFQAVHPWASAHNLSGLTLLPKDSYFSTAGSTQGALVEAVRSHRHDGGEGERVQGQQTGAPALARRRCTAVGWSLTHWATFSP